MGSRDNENDCQLLSSCEFSEGLGSMAEEDEIAVGGVDGFDLPLGVTSDEFSLYVAVDADVQTFAR